MSTPTDQQLIETIDSSINVLTNLSIPLYLDTEDKPTPFGTGFFVKRQNDIFLVTAAHVLDKAKSPSLYYYVTPNDIRHLSGHMVRSNHIDIGVVKMNVGNLPPYPDIQKFPMDISCLKPSCLPREDKHYSFTGFPATKTKVSNYKKNIEVTTYSYRSDAIPELEYSDHDLDINSHVVLPLNL
jgi:hypothetical protein